MSLVVLRRAFGPPGALEIDRTAGALEGALGQAATVWGLPSAAAGALGSHPVCLDPVCTPRRDTRTSGLAMV